MKNLKMTLLNSEELSEIQGGATANQKTRRTAGCSQSGHTIACGFLGKIKACAMYEVSCLPKFNSSCTNNSFSITGCSNVTFR